MSKKILTPHTMSPGAINRALDMLDVEDGLIGEQLIDAGRGRELRSETEVQDDPLSRRHKDCAARRWLLRREIERRWGPGAPMRFPKGWSESKRDRTGS